MRQRVKLLSNSHGTLHEEATRRFEDEEAKKEESMVQMVAPKVADPGLGIEDISLASDELTESLAAIELDQEQGF